MTFPNALMRSPMDRAMPLKQALQLAWPSLAHDEEALRALSRLGRSRRLGLQEVLFPQGSLNQDGSLWLLVKGRLGMGKQAAQGGWRQSRVVQAGQWVDIASAWGRQAYPESGLALTPVLLQEVSGDALLELGRQHPMILQALVKSLAEVACQALEAKQALSTQSFPNRLADWLLHEQKRLGDPETLGLGLLKQELAAQLDATPETLSRTLRLFQAQGLIAMQGRKIRLLDPARLARMNAPAGLGPRPRLAVPRAASARQAVHTGAAQHRAITP